MSNKEVLSLVREFLRGNTHAGHLLADLFEDVGDIAFAELLKECKPIVPATVYLDTFSARDLQPNTDLDEERWCIRRWLPGGDSEVVAEIYPTDDISEKALTRLLAAAPLLLLHNQKAQAALERGDKEGALNWLRSAEVRAFNTSGMRLEYPHGFTGRSVCEVEATDERGREVIVPEGSLFRVVEKSWHNSDPAEDRWTVVLVENHDISYDGAWYGFLELQQ